MALGKSGKSKRLLLVCLFRTFEDDIIVCLSVWLQARPGRRSHSMRGQDRIGVPGIAGQRLDTTAALENWLLVGLEKY